MTRREWSELAAAIKSEREAWAAFPRTSQAIGLVALRIATVLDAHHSRFDVKRFLSECGLPPG